MKLLDLKNGDSRPRKPAIKTWAELAQSSASQTVAANDVVERTYARLALEFLSQVFPHYVKSEDQGLFELAKDALKVRMCSFITERDGLIAEADTKIAGHVHSRSADLKQQIKSGLDSAAEKFNDTYQSLLATRAKETGAATRSR